jgi:hypothetical protein
VEPKLQSLIAGRKVLSIVHAVVALAGRRPDTRFQGWKSSTYWRARVAIDINGKTWEL